MPPTFCDSGELEVSPVSGLMKFGVLGVTVFGSLNAPVTGPAVVVVSALRSGVFAAGLICEIDGAAVLNVAAAAGAAAAGAAAAGAAPGGAVELNCASYKARIDATFGSIGFPVG